MVRGRLKNGVSKEQAQADMSNLAHRLVADVFSDQQGLGGAGRSTSRRRSLKKLGLGLIFIMGPVPLLLLISYSNFSNLLLTLSSLLQKHISILLSIHRALSCSSNSLPIVPFSLS